MEDVHCTRIKCLIFYRPLSQAEIQEANLDSSNVCMASLEREMRFLVKEVEGLRETAERVKGLEGDNRELTKQAAIDQRTLATLREVRGSLCCQDYAD